MTIQLSAPFRLRLLHLVILTTALLLLSALPATADPEGNKQNDPRPTIVLVHGAWAGPDGWDRVVAGLRKDGYETATPRLDLMSVQGDVARVRATLDSIPGKKILVAHSYGGFVISNAAYGRSDVLGLVYTAAYVPDEGDSVFSLGEGYTPGAQLEHLLFTGEPFASPAYIDPAYFPEVFAQDLNPRYAQELNEDQQPANFGLLFSPSGPVAWKTLPSWYAVSGRDLIIDPALQRAVATRIGATTIEYPAASHVGGFTRYAARFVKLIERADAETPG